MIAVAYNIVIPFVQYRIYLIYLYVEIYLQDAVRFRTISHDSWVWTMTNVVMCECSLIRTIVLIIAAIISK